jgi:hypothetical protein
MLSRLAKRRVQRELDLIAEELDSHGQAELASEIDEINDALVKGEITTEIASEELEHVADAADALESKIETPEVSAPAPVAPVPTVEETQPKLSWKQKLQAHRDAREKATRHAWWRQK